MKIPTTKVWYTEFQHLFDEVYKGLVNLKSPLSCVLHCMCKV